jgi:type II secretory ATPase GspE/PulE/Tfp pilus assembly ATPase PilB-like protein
MPRWIQQLGFSKPLLDRLMELLSRLSSLFLVTGPTGCGKSTSLYTLLNSIARPEIRILTAEDPIEYVFEHFTQFEVNDKLGTTYASYLRAFLHHDPEVIMLGEILDQEAAEMAFRAAQTGHLLLTTLHTTDAVSSVARLVDLEVPRNLIAASLLGVLSQRLVRMICTQCREEALPPAALLEEFFADGPPPVAWYRGRGCPRCNFTGYRGRIAVGELWAPTATDLELITSGATKEEIRASARASTLTMAEDVYGTLVAGRTTLDELKRVLPPHAIADFRRLPERDAADLIGRRPA